jgi:hypothetical protein
MASFLERHRSWGAPGDDLLGRWFPRLTVDDPHAETWRQMAQRASLWDQKHNFWAYITPILPSLAKPPVAEDDVKLLATAEALGEGMKAMPLHLRLRRRRIIESQAAGFDDRVGERRRAWEATRPSPRPTRAAYGPLSAAWSHDLLAIDEQTIIVRVLHLTGELGRDGLTRRLRSAETFPRCLADGRRIASELGRWPWGLFEDGTLPDQWWADDDVWASLPSERSTRAA